MNGYRRIWCAYIYIYTHTYILYIYIYINTMKYHSAIEKDEVMPFAAT